MVVAAQQNLEAPQVDKGLLLYPFSFSNIDLWPLASRLKGVYGVMCLPPFVFEIRMIGP